MSQANRNSNIAVSATVENPVSVSGPDCVNDHDSDVQIRTPANDNIRQEQLSAYWHAARGAKRTLYQPAITKMWWLP